MKICVVTHTFPKNRQDTTAAFMDPLVRGLITAGNDVTVFAPYHIDFIPGDFPYRIITYRYVWPAFLHRLGFSQTLKDGMRLSWDVYLLAPLLYFFGTLALWRLLRREHFDLVSSHWILPNGFLAFLATLGTKIPYVVSLPGSDVYVAQKNWIFQLMAQYSAGNSACLCADSPQYILELRKACVVDVPTHIIPYPVDTDVVKSTTKGVLKLRKNLGLTKKTITVLGVGRMVYKKGFNYLIEAVASIYTTHPNIKLVLIGTGDQMEEWQILSKHLGIKENVHFVGSVRRDEIITYYNACDIFVMPSIVDQLGNIDDRPVALLEAMACGLPVIATNFPGNALTITQNRSGLLVPEKDISAIVHALQKFISSPKLRKRLGKEASKSVVRNLSMYAVGKKYTEIFEHVKKTCEKY